MNRITLITGACLCATAIVGCVSLEERLTSTDPAVRKEAEQDLLQRQNYVLDAKERMKAVERVKDEEVLCNFASSISDPRNASYQDRRPEAMAAMEKITKDELLAKIAVQGDSTQIKAAAFSKIKEAGVKKRVKKELDARANRENERLLAIIDRSNDASTVVKAAMRIDYTRPGIGMEILTKHPGMIDKVVNNERHLENTRIERSVKSYSKLSKSVSAPSGFADKVFTSLTEQELKDLLNGGLDYRLKETAALRLLEVTEDPVVLKDMFDGNLRNAVGDNGREKAILKLAGMADKINDDKVIVEMLKAVENHSLKNYIENPEDRAKLVAVLSEDAAVKYALDEIEHHSVYSWNKNKLLPMNDAIAVTKVVKNPDGVVKIVSAMLAKIASYQKQCKDSWSMSWGKEDTDKANALVKNFPKFDDATVAALICSDATSWSYFIDSVSVNVAYNVLSGGKAMSAELELALVKKLPKEKIDMAVYNGTKYDETKKAVNAVMPPELKKQAAEAAEKAYAAIVEKAKNAAKETFELDGFYLGMLFDDMKVVLAHHFPDWQITEANDGEGKDADFVIYVPGQNSPFCYAGCEDKKVYLFNFGKKMLKKWYKYDVQDYAQWASAYSRENKINMQYKMVEKEATVYEPMDMSRSYRVWFYQHSYQYKHNAKEYRLTYFGDEKDFTVHGGIGGAVIKELAAPKFRYTRGDPGSLRVKIEKD